jgi:uracil-DNA glycosylase
MTIKFNVSAAHHSWQTCLNDALNLMDQDYLNSLYASHDWLPGPEKIFNAFSLPLNQVNYVLFGESPYPRKESANGYAFWDANVHDIWSPTGLSKQVNRATSLRNMIKMLLVADDKLTADQTGQDHIAQVDKQLLVTSNAEFFNNLINHGFLLLNASPVLQPSNVRIDAKKWRPFLEYVVNYLLKHNPNASLVLLGNIANDIKPLVHQTPQATFEAEHPYNISFIQNPVMLDFFRPLRLLRTT